MRNQIIRVLLFSTDVREAQWVRQALTTVRAHQAGFCWMVKSAKTLKAAIGCLHRKETDIIMAGLPSSGRAGARFLLRLREAAPSVPIIALVGVKDEKLLVTVSALGLLEAIRKGSSGQPDTVSAVVATGRSRTRSPEIEKLTPRELEIFTLIADGKSTKEVAGHLDIAVKTAETHRTNLMRKLKVHSVSQLVRFAIRHKVVEV